MRHAGQRLRRQDQERRTQVVKAPKQTTDAKKGTVKTGGDLRSGKK